MNNILKKMAISILISLTVAVLLVAAFSLVLPHIDAADKLSGVLGWGLRSLFCLLAAFLCARGSRSKGLITGAAVGVVYAVVLFLLSAIISHQAVPPMAVIKNLSVCVLCGAIGGILGINI